MSKPRWYVCGRCTCYCETKQKLNRISGLPYPVSTCCRAVVTYTYKRPLPHVKAEQVKENEAVNG